MVQMSRRQFLRVTGATIAGSSLALLGFAPGQAMAEVRQYKLSRTTETRNTCPYCSVGCGVLLYGLGDGAKNAVSSIIHVEGDADHPVNRGTLCPKGASLVDFIHSPNRLKVPEYRAPGGTEWQPISWDVALDKIARLMKDDRDANLIQKNEAGATVKADGKGIVLVVEATGFDIHHHRQETAEAGVSGRHLLIRFIIPAERI